MSTFSKTHNRFPAEPEMPRIAVAGEERSSVTLPPHIVCMLDDAPDAVVAFTSDPQLVAMLVQRARGRLLVVMPPQASTEAVGAALDAGADACVCGHDPRLVAAHLAALLRRERCQP